MRPAGATGTGAVVYGHSQVLGLGTAQSVGYVAAVLQIVDRHAFRERGLR